MTFLEKLDYLMKEKDINKRKLSVESGIPYTTIDGFYKQGYANIRLTTFKKICDYFLVTMDSMAHDEVEMPEHYNSSSKKIHISEGEQMLIECYRRADALDRELALRALGVREKGGRSKMA